jgi:hypothetical protein
VSSAYEPDDYDDEPEFDIDPGPGDDDDGWQEYKDDLAQGRIHEDGSYREPDPEDHPEFERCERERYLRSLSPLARLREPARPDLAAYLALADQAD